MGRDHGLEAEHWDFQGEFQSLASKPCWILRFSVLEGLDEQGVLSEKNASTSN